MYAEEELLPLSGLQHLLYCERQCALIHIEGAWAENIFTVEGDLNHERVHAGGERSEPNLRTAFSLHLRSLALGISGIADVVEFHRSGPGAPWLPFPVEHKRGRPKAHDADRVQLCAQALCLEEMLGVAVPAGALFYGKTRRRQDMAFDAALRQTTAEAATRFHELVNVGKTPRADYDAKRCDACSLISVCQPKLSGANSSVRAYLAGALAAREDA